MADSKDAGAKTMKLAVIHEILPQEIFVMILKKLRHKSISVAMGTCRHWKKVIEDFDLVKIASRKFISFFVIFFLSIISWFRFQCGTIAF